MTEERGIHALATGEEIIREYPSSRMAQKVRDKMDLLKTRATGNA
jgi:outer membrane protein assembly factor BamD (BamD/ComL family)